MISRLSIIWPPVTFLISSLTFLLYYPLASALASLLILWYANNDPDLGILFCFVCSEHSFCICPLGWLSPPLSHWPDLNWIRSTPDFHIMTATYALPTLNPPTLLFIFCSTYLILVIYFNMLIVFFPMLAWKSASQGSGLSLLHSMCLKECLKHSRKTIKIWWMLKEWMYSQITNWSSTSELATHVD